MGGEEEERREGREGSGMQEGACAGEWRVRGVEEAAVGGEGNGQR